MSASTTSPLLAISDLRLSVRTPRGLVEILDGVDLEVRAGETVGLVGESGSGKSTTLRSALDLLPSGAVTSGTVDVDGLRVLGEPDYRVRAANVRTVRRDRAAMVFQDPRSALNPVRRIGDSVTERLVRVHGIAAAAARRRILGLFEEVGLREPERLLRLRPHEVSGGMLQRVMIAAALSTDPDLLLADEATSALDVTTQAEVLALLRRLRAERGMGVLFITHDLLLASAYCDRVCVMERGRIVEEQPASSIFLHPKSAYTARLAAATPRLAEAPHPQSQEQRR